MVRSNSIGSIGAIGLALGLFAGACDLEAELEREPCEVDDDCWHTQHCARTLEEEQLGQSGMCLPEGEGCAFGAQLGCGCNPEDFEADCSAFDVVRADTYPVMTCEPERLVCVVMTEEGET